MKLNLQQHVNSSLLIDIQYARYKTQYVQNNHVLKDKQHSASAAEDMDERAIPFVGMGSDGVLKI